MTDTIRVGTVGATVTRGGSGWGANAHVPALRALPEYELWAVCTQHEETARASADAFGAEVAFHDFATMLAEPEIDLVTVVVRVPRHYDLVMQALQAGKAVFCEWPLGASVSEVERMASLAAERSLPTAVGLQARSDPTLMYARELVAQGDIGEVLMINLTYTSQAVTRRGEGRIWQADRRNAANTLTIAAGHTLDAMCFVVGEFDEVSARLATTITEWLHTDTGQSVKVDSPDWISVSGRLEGGAQASCLVATVPSNPAGTRLEIYGTQGSLVLSAGSFHAGPTRLQMARGGEPLAPMDVPDRFKLVPEDLPAGAPRNVGQAYARLARALLSRESYQPDFAHALQRHRLIAAIEDSAAKGGQSVRVGDGLA
jgi:predicted dehydrogenase